MPYVRQVLLSVVCLLASWSLLVGTVFAQEESHLYIWVDGDGKVDDFLAVADIRPKSAHFGSIVRTVSVKSKGNRPHHCALIKTSDHARIFAGGLYSNQLFVFDVGATPRQPSLVKSVDLESSGYGAPDDFVAMSDGRVLVTMMGKPDGRAPGGIVRLSGEGQVLAAYPGMGKTPPYYPHGIDISEERGQMITTDLIDRATFTNIRTTVHLWDLGAMEIVHTFKTGDGPMEAKFIPGKDAALISCMFDGTLWLLKKDEHGQYGVQRVFDYDELLGEHAHPGSLLLLRNGTRLLQALGAGEVVMLDITTPTQPKVIDRCRTGTGSHFLAMDASETRAFVSNYFLKPAGVDGDHHVRLLHIKASGLETNDRFDLDFDALFAEEGPAYPHGMVLY